jgi:hypothetical protein
MTREQLQELIDAVDIALLCVPSDIELKLGAVSNLLVDLPDEAVEGLSLRLPEDEEL